jgi:hypothetical protein
MSWSHDHPQCDPLIGSRRTNFRPYRSKALILITPCSTSRYIYIQSEREREICIHIYIYIYHSLLIPTSFFEIGTSTSYSFTRGWTPTALYRHVLLCTVLYCIARCCTLSALHCVVLYCTGLGFGKASWGLVGFGMV